MSTVIAKNVQVGADGTASNNFTVYQPATPDGTLRIGNGNSGTTSNLVTVTSAGNVGVGTSSPQGKFNVGGGRSNFGANSETYSIGLGYTQARVNSGQAYYIGATDSATPDIVFSNAAGTERARITDGGNVLINTTTNTNNSRVVVNGVIESTSGGVRFPDGTTQTTAPVSGQLQFQLFTATGTTTWTAPAGVTRVKAVVIGGGGGANGNSGANGGGGGFAIGEYTVVPGTGYSITVGAGGAGIISGTAGSGGSSSFASFCSATGGAGQNNTGSGGASGTGSGGNIRNGSTVISNLAFNATPPFTGLITYNATTAAQVWSVSSTFAAGSPGAFGATAGGGFSGIVFLEWVG